MKKTINIFTIVTVLFSIILVASCQKETLYLKDTLTVEDLITQYNLKKSPALSTENSMVFSSADEAAKFIEAIKRAKPVKFLTNTSTISSKLQANASNNSNIIFSSESENVKSVAITSLGSTNSSQTPFSGGTMSEGGTRKVVKPVGGGLSSYRVDLSYDAGYKNLKANGSISGFALGVTFTQTGSAASYANNKISFEVTGGQNYNIIVEGIGTIWTQPIIMEGYYDFSNSQSLLTVSNN